MIKCISFQVLLKPFDIKEEDPTLAAAKRMGITLTGDSLEREQKSVDKGTVVSWGPTAFKEYGIDVPFEAGDQIVFAKFAGKEVIDPETNEKFVVILDQDCIAILKNGAKDGR